jgi:serine/threonine protein kinase/formylglycine-generating enzyme required for sulfatase activity
MADNIKKIGKYAIESEIGRGAMGKVYKGLDPVINRHVAIKAFSGRDTDSEDNDLSARFRQEAQAGGRLNHPGIVSVYEYGEDGDLAFIAMELVEGHTLAELIKQQIHFDFEEVSNLMIQVLEALQYAHSNGVVHRDIKPSNIMRTDSGDIKIADFGIARLESSELTQTGTVMGTLSYMSPEQLMGRQVDHRSDIFSCGTLFYELLTGESAFSSTNTASTMYKVVHTELPPASKICPTVPASFDPVLARALAKNPEERFGSAQEFAQAIKAIIQGDNQTTADGPTAEPIDDKTVVRPPPGATTPPPTRLQHGERSASHYSKNRWLYLLGASMLVLVVVGTFVLQWFPKLLYSTDGKSVATDSVLPSDSTEASQQPVTPPVMAPESVTSAFRAGNRFKDCATCPDMIVVPRGTFTQGSSVSESGRESNEGPQHSVRIDYPLAVAQFEVTRQQFAQFVSDTGYALAGCSTYEEGSWKLRNDRDWQSPGFYQDETEPVTCVSWEDARRYTDWLAKKTGKDYRLLSASEWEYIARAGTDTARNWGNNPNIACQFTNIADRATQDNYPGWGIHDCMDGYVYTAPMENLKPNEFGVYATLGNVFEWVEDCWNNSYQGAPKDGSAWTDGDCAKRSLRGGSWFSQPKYVRSAFRNSFNSDARASTFGFRVARELPSG